MPNTENGKMNTDYVGHHVSAGGYIFYKDDQTGEDFVLLIENANGEFWIPKGHIEEGEDHVAAAFREIEEEVGIKEEKLTHIGLSHVHSYTFTDDQGRESTKEVYVNVFQATEKCPIVLEDGNDSICGGEWFPFAEAVKKIIPYSKKGIIKAERLFSESVL